MQVGSKRDGTKGETPRRAKPPRTRNGDADANATRNRILDVAMREFAENGFAGARVDRNAQRAGVNKQLLYYYFDDKKGLYDAAIAEFKLLQADKSRAVFALTMIGECVEAKGELGEAVGKYKEALNLSQVTLSESLELYYLLGSVFERLGDVREALYFFENVHKRDASFRDVGRRIAALKPAKARQA